MRLKLIFRLIFICFFVFSLSSCNSDSEYEYESASSNAQIYSFSLAAHPINALDSVNYPVLAKTRFTIDQGRSLIFNPDSLPYRTRVGKFETTITYSGDGVSKVELQYPNDSIVEWNGSDSIDFSIPSYPRFMITAANGSTKKTYSLDLRVHKINPDTLVWTNITALRQPSSIKRQKVFLKDDMFYSFAEDNGSLYLYEAGKNSSSWDKTEISGLNASTINLKSLTLYKDNYYVIDNSQNGYMSSDGINWSRKGGNIYSILGVLPAATENKDSLLVMVKDAEKYYFAKTIDLENLVIVTEISGVPNYLESNSEFPLEGFSAVTNFDRKNLNNNILSITGGTSINGQQTNLSWIFQVDEDNVLRMAANQMNYVFPANSDLTTYIYDGYLWALTQNTLYKSASWGYKWLKTEELEQFDSRIPRGEKSVVVDNENYVWVFSGILYIDNPVWKGRINKLNL